MRQIVKEPAVFADNCDVDSIINYYNTSYPKGKQLTRDNFKAEGIDLTKLDVKDVLATVRAQMLSVKIYFVETKEDLNKMLTYLKKFDAVAFDSETTNIKLATHPDVIMWSFAAKTNEAFVVPYTFNVDILDYLTSTTQMMVAHNLGFDEKIIHRLSGKFLRNRHDTFLIAYALLNDSKQTPKLSLKELAKSTFGSWAEDVSDLKLTDVNNNNLIYYAGIDAVSCLFVFNQHKKAIMSTPDVNIFDILPSEHPSKRSYSRYWFYKNVARQILPITIEMMNTGLPLNMDRVHKLDGELDEILGKADAEVLQLPTVLKCWEEFKLNKANEKKAKYLEGVDANQVKIYKPTNQTYINLFVETMYPDKVLPSKAKNWTPTVIATFDKVLAEAIKNKNLESLRDTYKYAPIFDKVEDLLTTTKIAEKQAKINKTAENTYSKAILDLDFKPLTSAAQKKYIFQKGYGITANNKSMATGEDSFNKEELSRLAKEIPEGTELRKFVDLCIIYSGGAIIKKNFVKNFKKYVEPDGRIRGMLGIGRALSYRPTSGGSSKLNLLNIPSSRSPYSKPIKRCIQAPEGWIWSTLDFTALEIACNAIVVEDRTLMQILLEGRDA